MEFSEYKEKAFDAAIKAGCGAAEAYFTSSEIFMATIIDTKLDSYSVSRSGGLNLRVQLDGKNGYAYTEALDDPETLVKHAMDNARSIEDIDEHPMQGACTYQEVEHVEDPLFDMSEKEKIDIALKLETATKNADPRVQRVGETDVQTVRTTRYISNTLGLNAHDESCISMGLAMPIVEKDGEVKDAYKAAVGKDILDVDTLAKSAVKKATDCLGASPVATGKYNVIIEKGAVAELLSAFAPMFCADMAQKGLSLLNGKEGERIASELVSLIDDPFCAQNPSAFDAEGVPSMKTTVIDNGVLKTLLHNLKTAKKAGCESTANAGRQGEAAPVSVAPTNFYIKSGDKSFDELVRELNNGVIITSFAGTHAGLNTVSGDFSLLAKGQLVENGKIVRAVEQITAAGTFYDLMKNVYAVGSDFELDPLYGFVGGPSLLVSDVMISGK